MKNPLKLLFSLVSGKPAFSPDSVRTLPLQGASNPFTSATPQMARFGSVCSTRAFFNVQGHVEWYTGQQGPDHNWTMRKITEMPNVSGAAVPVGEMVRQTNVVMNGVAFFDAIKILANYELGQLALGTLPADPDEQTPRSGQMHYTDFAEREGIVFDTSGAPYPTLNGEVVGDGVFSIAALDRARAVQMKQSSFAQQGGNDFLGALISPAKDRSDQFSATIQNVMNGSRLTDIIKRVEDIDALIECGFFTKIYLAEDKNMMSVTAPDLMNIRAVFYYDNLTPEITEEYNLKAARRLYAALCGKKTLPETVAYLVDEINDSIDRLHMGDTQKAFLRSDIASLALYYEVSALRYNAQYTAAHEHARRQAYITLQDSAPKLEARFLELGGTADSVWKIKSFLLEKPSTDKPAAKPQAIAELLQALRLVRGGLLQEEVKTTQMVVAGPHVSSSTVSLGPR